MGTYRYFLTGNGPVLTEPSEKFEYISYEECLGFLKHLRERGRNLAKRSVKGMFNTFDLTKNDIEKLMIIKEAPDEETAYFRIAEYCSRKQPNCNHKLMPELKNIYREDLYDYLVENGIDNTEKLSDLISRGEYKEYRKHNPKVLSDNFDQWAKACNYLPSRNMFKKIYTIEYKLYQNRKEYEEVTKDVTRITLWCENLERFRIGKENILKLRLADLFDMYNPSDTVIHGTPVRINYQIIQITIKDIDVEGESGNHYDLYEKLSSWNDVTSIELEYENGAKREFIVKWSDDLFDETDGITDFYQRHVPEIRDGQFTNVFTSSFIIEYWNTVNSEKESCDMISAVSQDTGLPFTVWLYSAGIKKTEPNTPIIMIDADGERIPVSISKDPQILVNRNVPHFSEIRLFIINHYEDLMKHWNNEISDREILNILAENLLG